MYAIPTRPQVWGDVVQASRLSDLLELVQQAHDQGLDGREFWVNRCDSKTCCFWVSMMPGDRYRIRYADNIIETNRSMLAAILSEALADGMVFSRVIGWHGMPVRASEY